jgi:hypothetical protein
VGLTPAAKTYALDFTHPLVLEKIHREMRWLYDLGFRYFKTDFLQTPNSNFRRAKFHDPSVTPVEGMRRAMEVIRGAIGEDSYWLACGTEILPLAGLPDASRVSDDVTLQFSTCQVAVRNCATHFWCNGSLWLNDPDFLVVRGRDTAVDGLLYNQSVRDGANAPTRPYQRATLGTGPYASLEEARAWADFHIVYGGVCAWSDEITRLTGEGIALARKVLDYHAGGGIGVPLDLEERCLPRRWLRPYPGGWLLGLFNWDDKPATIILKRRDLRRIGPAAKATDIWTGQEQPWDNKTFAVGIPPHQSRVFHVTRA